jgi:2-polyprenyl-3-methyl-5-hydroxy-6-metoxy-1,4-benzoquinol methylase
LRRRLLGTPPKSGGQSFGADEIDAIMHAYYGREHDQAAAMVWNHYRDAHMRLPDWFDRQLDPWSQAYLHQQLKLWQLMAGVESAYDPNTHEADVGWENVDAIRQPGYYVRRDARAVAVAGDHWLATGMLLKHCGLQAGDRALEYGAGFGQSALALARLGVQVDTVDISPRFCRYIAEQAEFFRVQLTAHHGRFGHHPRPGERYKLIWFYESFHHCLDFAQVVPKLVTMLAPGGKIILGGEPIVEQENAAVPYPWGMRLHSEVAAVVRATRWCELGLSEQFLFELFGRHAMQGTRLDCDPSEFARLYVFSHEAG